MYDDREKRRQPASRSADAPRLDYFAPITLVICGEPVVGRALVLVLRGSRYDVRFLTAASLSDPGALDGVQLLLLTSTFDSRWGEDLLVELGLAPGGDAGIPVLQLIAASERTPKGETRPGHVLPWPCSIEELERRIEAVLLAGPGNRQKADRSPLPRSPRGSRRSPPLGDPRG